MKVVMLSRESLPFHSYGGMQRYVWCLARYLAKQGVRIELVLPPPYNNEKRDTIKGIKFTFIGPTVRKPFFWTRYFLFALRASNYLNRQAFDILHGFEICPFFYLLNKKRKPTVIQTFGNEPLKTVGIKRIIHNLRWAPFFKYVVRRADSIGSIGDKQTEELEELFLIPREKIFLLPDGVDLERITKDQQSLAKRREDIGFSDGDLVLICVARLAVNKGVQYLIQTMKILNQKLTNIKLILIGSGPEEKKIKEAIERLGLSDKVRHFKDITDNELFQYYALSDIFILPTLYEGLPLVLLEACASGLPIITTRITDNEQIVKEGENGFLVPPADSEGLAQAIIKIRNNNLKEEMSEASRKIAQGYSWSNVAILAIEKYHELLAGQKNRIGNMRRRNVRTAPLY